MGNIHTVGPNQALIVSGKTLYLIPNRFSLYSYSQHREVGSPGRQSLPRFPVFSPIDLLLDLSRHCSDLLIILMRAENGTNYADYAFLCRSGDFCIYSEHRLLGEINDWKYSSSLHFSNQQNLQNRNDSLVGLFLLTC